MKKTAKGKAERLTGIVETAAQLVEAADEKLPGAGLIPGVKAMNVVVKLYREQQEKRRQQWWDELCGAPCWDLPPDEVQKAILEKLGGKDGDKYHEIFAATFRELQNMLCDAAIVPLASLVAERLQKRLPLDARFRGMIRVLSDLSSEEIATLGRLLRRCRELAVTMEVDQSKDISLGLHASRKDLLTIFPPEAWAPVHFSFSGELRRIFRLMKSNDFASETAPNVASRVGALGIQISMSTIIDLDRHLSAVRKQ